MPLTALTESGQKIYLPDHEKKQLEGMILFSPYPEFKEIRVFPVGGSKRRLHVRHPAGCVSEYEHCNESPEHLEGKQVIRASLLRSYPSSVVDLEVPLLLPSGAKRIADVARLRQDGLLDIHEVQLSQITMEILEERTNDYESLGHEVTWHFGKKMLNDNTRDWALDRFGAYYSIAFKENIVEYG